MDIRQLLRKAFAWGPVFFGVGFVAPLVAQTLEATATTPPLGFSAIQTGLVVGIAAGTVAKLRGRWI